MATLEDVETTVRVVPSALCLGSFGSLLLVLLSFVEVAAFLVKDFDHAT
jgi:hypothetical protein